MPFSLPRLGTAFGILRFDLQHLCGADRLFHKILDDIRQFFLGMADRSQMGLVTGCLATKMVQQSS